MTDPARQGVAVVLLTPYVLKAFVEPSPPWSSRVRLTGAIPSDLPDVHFAFREVGQNSYQPMDTARIQTNGQLYFSASGFVSDPFYVDYDGKSSLIDSCYGIHVPAFSVYIPFLGP